MATNKFIEELQRRQAEQEKLGGFNAPAPEAPTTTAAIPDRQRVSFPDNPFGGDTDIGPSRENRSLQMGAPNPSTVDEFNATIGFDRFALDKAAALSQPQVQTPITMATPQSVDRLSILPGDGVYDRFDAGIGQLAAGSPARNLIESLPGANSFYNPLAAGMGAMQASIQQRENAQTPSNLETNNSFLPATPATPVVEIATPESVANLSVNGTDVVTQAAIPEAGQVAPAAVVPQAQLPSTIQNANGQDLMGFKPKYEGQTLTDFMAGRDDPSAASVQVQDPQGRFRRQAAPVAGETLEQNQARTDALFQEQADFQQASAAREARQAARPDFGEAQTRAAGTVTDAERRGNGAPTSLFKEEAEAAGLSGRAKSDFISEKTRLWSEAKEDRNIAKAKSGKLTTAEKQFLLNEKKYNDILEKEKDGVPLTPADKLAREKFEYEQRRDVKSDAAGPDKSATERNIDTMMKANPDMSYTEAANIVQNVVSKTTDPLSGRTAVTNIAKGTSTPMQSTEPLASSVLNLKPKAAGEGLYSRGANETGVVASLLRGGQKVTGQAGFDIASDESIEVKKELDAFQGSLSRAFQEGDRFSSSQDKILREELDVTLGAWKDPKTFQANMRSLDKVLRKRHSDLTENYNDLTLDSNFRADSRSKAKVIEQALNDMGVTQETPPTEGDTPPEGINPRAAAAWATMSPEGRALFQPQAK